MAKTASDTNIPSAPDEETLKQRKKQARQEAKLMLEIEKAKKALKKAQKKQSKAQVQMEARSTHVQTLEARLTELRAPGPEPEIETPPQSAELELQQEPQEPSELESSIDSSDGKQPASPDQEHQGEITALTDQAISVPQVENSIDTTSSSSETGTSTSTDAEPGPPFVEEARPSEDMNVTHEVTGKEVMQDNELPTETELAPTAATAGKASARKPAATKRPASRSHSSKQSPSDAG